MQHHQSPDSRRSQNGTRHRPKWLPITRERAAPYVRDLTPAAVTARQSKPLGHGQDAAVPVHGSAEIAATSAPQHGMGGHHPSCTALGDEGQQFQFQVGEVVPVARRFCRHDLLLSLKVPAV
jgi:hypothetical protein